MSFLQIKNISYIYDGESDKHPALVDIDFSVCKGESVCIAGANGCGKSTLLQIMAACMKPNTGDILIDGISIFKDDKTRRKTGIVFQEPDNQLFMPTVWEDVAFSLLTRGVKIEAAKEKALAALRLVEAESLSERPPYKLSGGEKQRAALAGVIILFQEQNGGEVLLIDEPTAALDPRARKNLITLLQKLPCTKIIATHDLDMALDVCSEVIFLDKGKLASRSPTPGLLNDEAFLQSIGLELPLRYQ
jgi:cobalt/nickel transport system ATP-binding protein